jgi:hypothetical protein
MDGRRVARVKIQKIRGAPEETKVRESTVSSANVTKGVGTRDEES